MTNVVCLVIAALMQIESCAEKTAIGDGGKAVGILQMWPISVREANRIAGAKIWRYEDRKNAEKSKEMAAIILSRQYRRGVTDPVELACRWRNPGGDAPMWYKKKVIKQLKK